MSRDATRTYEFGSAAEDQSLLAGLRAGQVATVSVGLITSVVSARLIAAPLGLPIAFAIATVAAALALTPVAGRTAEQWAPPALRHAAATLLRRNLHLTTLARTGHDAQGRATPSPPPSLRGVDFSAVALADSDGQAVGLVHDRWNGRLAAIIKVQGRSFQLADTEEKQHRLASWGRLLAGLARSSSSIARLQWIEGTVPERGDSLQRYLDDNAHPDEHVAAHESYRTLIEQAGPTSPRHETYLVVAIDQRRARRAISRAGGGDEGAAQVLLREVRSLERELRSADISVEGVLTEGQIVRLVRSCFGSTEAAHAPDSEPRPPNWTAWPAATDVTWSALRTDQAWHATYWIASWPRTPVGADFLVPFLLGARGTRIVSVSMEPVPPTRAHREVQQQRLKQTADEELRAGAGFLATARRRHVRATIERREEELAAGHADFRLSGFVTVTSDDRTELEVLCGEAEQVAHQSGLELLRLYGQQDKAFTYTLPLARGLSGRH